jgi:hypothetical protein
LTTGLSREHFEGMGNKGRKLIPNPAHGGEQMTEEY